MSNTGSLFPTSRFDSSGHLTRINFNNQVRDYHMSIPHAMVKPVYRSLKLFNDLCYDPRNMVEYKLNPGESLIYEH